METTGENNGGGRNRLIGAMMLLHAIFFHDGFANHGTNDISRLGGPVSHGCVRLHPSHAAALYALAEHNGPRIRRIKFSNWRQGCAPP
jgi:lipoprotein-anchoring transpeptidase ErfK/SrfK